MHQWIDMASLVRAKGSKGRFVARFAPGLSFMLPEGEEVCFVPPTLDGPRRARVAEATPFDEKTFEVVFQGIEGRQVADTLVGSHCLVRRAAVQEALPVDVGCDLEGYRLVADGVEVGVVAALRDNPGQQLLEVDRPDCPKALLVPFVDEFIDAIDHDVCIIHAQLPAGLLDL